LALASGDVTLPDGPLVFLNAPGDVDLAGLAPDRLTFEQDIYPDYKILRDRNLNACARAEGVFSAAILFLPRAKAHARALVARAAALTKGGLILVDGQKTDGVAALLKALKNRVELQGVFSKAHGKLLWFTGGDFADWAEVPMRVGEGFITRPGVFSADGPDAGSALLAEALPSDLSGQGADLGAGWGYLARRILQQSDVTRLDLVEASHTALTCARENLKDPRAHFQWADARVWRPQQPVDFVITNPPFHTGRKGDPDLGRAFITSAARMLAHKGSLYLVANRHLPYEAELEAAFRHVHEMGATPAFKLFNATTPRRKPVKMR